MLVSFKMEDKFLAGDYDSRVHNDVVLYIFKDDRMVRSLSIPYSSIAGGKYYPVAKTQEMSGNVTLVAWAVKSGETDTATGAPLTVHHDYQHPEYKAGDDYSSRYLAHSPLAGTEYYSPQHHERYLGVLAASAETMADENSRHDIIMAPAPGRVLVNIYDPLDQLGRYREQGGTLGQEHMVVEGGMSNMRLGSPSQGRHGHTGYGSAAAVYAALYQPEPTRAAGPLIFSSGMVGVLPSANATSLTVRVSIMEREVVLKISSSDHSFFEPLRSGDVIQFDYELPEGFIEDPVLPTKFDVWINGWKHLVVNNGTSL